MSTLPRSTISFPPGTTPFPVEWTLADVRHLLGDIPLNRIAVMPPIGTAMESDVERIQQQDGRLFELEYGILVEKTMGWYESLIGGLILRWIGNFVDEHDLGQVLGADGLIKILPGVVKIPDVCFLSWSKFPVDRLARTPIPTLVPDLMVEILSESNTAEEMRSKLNRYFEAGVGLVWYVDPTTRSAMSYTSSFNSVRIAPNECLSGAGVLPGFTLSLKTLFEKADQQAAMQ